MIKVPKTYIAGDSLVHKMDPRAKTVALLAYSIGILLVSDWLGMAVCAVLFFAMVAISKLSVGNLAKVLIPLWVILLFTLIFNALTFNVAALESYELSGIKDGFWSGYAPIALVGSLAFVPAGFERGLFYIIRIAFLCMAGLIVAYTTETEKLTQGFMFFLKPLRLFKVHTEDIAMTFSIALRFIPLTVEELAQVRMAQLARGAGNDEGSAYARVKSWGNVMIPLFVNLFRRADTLSQALSVRGYGACDNRTSLESLKCTALDWAALAIVLACCVAAVVI